MEPIEYEMARPTGERRPGMLPLLCGVAANAVLLLLVAVLVAGLQDWIRLKRYWDLVVLAEEAGFVAAVAAVLLGTARVVRRGPFSVRRAAGLILGLVALCGYAAVGRLIHHVAGGLFG